MRAWFGLAALALIAGVLQATLLARIGGFLPLNLLLVMAVLVGLQREFQSGAAMAVGLGYLQDLFSGSIPGLHMTAWLLVFFLAQASRERFSPERPGTQFMLGVFLCVSEMALVVILARLFSEPIPLEPRQLGFIGIAVLIESAMVALFFPLSARLLAPELLRRR